MTTEANYEGLLQEWGATEIEAMVDEILFEYDGYSYSILITDFGSSMKDCLDSATLWSCCGIAVDKDFMICPDCGEHM